MAIRLGALGIAVAAGTMAGAALLGTTATVSAQPPPPNCTAADLSGVAAGVTAATSAYLFTHPDVNAFFTSLKGLPREEVRVRVGEYADANPQVRADLQGIRQPMVDFRNRCGAPGPTSLPG
ncbi:hemophore-related protein [Mycobacterium sp. PS03-16]|uniref:heme-binding protein n=1 Tax=Mycobacterium sp. PS03-16 TaxID=2559611 RepID=UPI0010741D76|nr:heme-binding protein [Mycobacterium sp. PS03-16]TFV56823.1 hemophore-related protein [Mycobacterium sp. PS03-16]